jgi:hypothetical protein
MTGELAVKLAAPVRNSCLDYRRRESQPTG